LPTHKTAVKVKFHQRKKWAEAFFRRPVIFHYAMIAVDAPAQIREIRNL
jgi:hypothetical protein